MRRPMIFGVALIAGCATTELGQSADIPYLYEDLIPMKAFGLTYKNETSKPMCLTPDNWPNDAGKLDQASSRAWVEIKGTQSRYAIKDFNTGYCPQCAQRVRPGETVTGIIPYEEFLIPEKYQSAKKTLHFHAQGFVCK